MKKKEILKKIRSVKLCMMAHPDNEKDSEFEDRINDLESIERAFTEVYPAKSLFKILENKTMDQLEKIYEDKKAWIFFSGEENETIGVYCRCPECGKYIKHGKLLMNGIGNIKLQGFTCKIHGIIQPYFDRECGKY